jgi:hypothetical protein
MQTQMALSNLLATQLVKSMKPQVILQITTSPTDHNGNYLWGLQITRAAQFTQPAQPMNAGGLVQPGSIRGNVLGLDLYVDKNFAVTTTIDDSAVILAPEAFTVYRSATNYMSVNVVSNLQVQVAIYGYMATIAKMPNGIVKFNLN